MKRTPEPLVVTLFDAPPPAAGSSDAAEQAVAAAAPEQAAAEPKPPEPVEKPRRKRTHKPKLAKAEPTTEPKALPEPAAKPKEEPEAEKPEPEAEKPEPEAKPAEERPKTAEATQAPDTATTGAKAGQGDPSATRTGAHGNGDDASAKPAKAAPSTRKIEVLPFGPGMTRPEVLSKVDPIYTREARQAKVSGLFLAKCVLTTKGQLQNCRVVKGLPMMNEAILKAIARWRYSPVEYQGKAVNVDYLFKLRLAAP